MEVKGVVVQVNQRMSKHHSVHIAQYGLNNAGHMWTRNIMTHNLRFSQ